MVKLGGNPGQASSPGWRKRHSCGLERWRATRLLTEILGSLQEANTSIQNESRVR